MKIVKERIFYPPKFKTGGDYANNATTPNDKIDVEEFSGLSDDGLTRIYVPAGTIDINTDLDTGSPETSVFYGIWAVWNPITQIGAFKFSKLSTTPDLATVSIPAGWKKRFIGTVRRDIIFTTEFFQPIKRFQLGTMTYVQYQDTAEAVLSDGSATSATPIDASSKIPKSSQWGSFNLRARKSGFTFTVYFYENGKTDPVQVMYVYEASTCLDAKIPTDTTQKIAYRNGTASAYTSVYVNGYYERNW